MSAKLGFESRLKNDDALNLKNFEYLEVPNQAKFHPLKFLYALAEIAEKKGVKIFENTEATKISSKDVLTVSTKDSKIKTSDVIVATYKPFNNPREVFAKKGMYKSYMLELEIPKNLLAEALYSDQSNPYYYFRVDKGHAFDRMLLGGADHREELPVSEAKSYKALKEHLHNILGDVQYKIIKKWPGPILESSDGLGLIGEYKPHQFLATGFSGNGMTYSAISAIMFKDYVLGKKNDWTEVFDPKRPFKLSSILKKGKDYIEEFFGGAVRNTFKFRLKEKN
ncbi:MAG TPA: FAD-binding oxidoreductase [Patescibacteria group bacterium]|nr:FAD-binding oxidoreductase [Patescibacteria group bacterium]